MPAPGSAPSPRPSTIGGARRRWSTRSRTPGISILVVDAPRLDTALPLRDRRPELGKLIAIGGGAAESRVLDYEEFIASAPIEDTQPDPDELAVLMYTGGTTGRSKGVMLSATQIFASALGSLVSGGLDNLPQRNLHVAPLFHLAAFAGLVQHVLIGSTHIMMGDFDVARLVTTIAEKRVTQATLVPTMAQWMLDHADATGTDISSLRYIGYGAAPMPEPLVRRLLQQLPDAKLRQGYGMTELGPVATVLRDEDHHDAEHPERLRSVGRAAAHAEVRVVDADDVEVPRGSVGEIVVRGAHVMLGYWQMPAETAEALRGGWMHTGDAGYMDEYGYVFLVDRIKDMIVSGGENVYSAEVEKVLHAHPAVASCAVIGVPDETWGERVHAVLVLNPGHDLTEAQVREFVGARIARYKAPRTVDFVNQLPLSPVGKILKRVLREEYAR